MEVVIATYGDINETPEADTDTTTKERALGSTEFTREEWTLKQERGRISTNILIAKARWVFHCEHCNVDHNRKKRINQAVILKRTQRRMEVVVATYGDINDTQEAETDTKKRENTE